MRGRILTSWVIIAGTIMLSCLFSSAKAEQVWDDDLNRYLTPEELGHEEVYLTVEEAAQLMFPQSDLLRKEVVVLTPEQKATVEARIGWHFPEESFEVFIGETNGKVDGYAFIQNTIGKHKPMTYMVGVDPQGRATNVEVLVYRESRGSEVRKKTIQLPVRG